MAYLVIYRPHNQLNCDTQYIGPFESHDDAYDYLCELPAIGQHNPGSVVDNPGVKFVQEIAAPQR